MLGISVVMNCVKGNMLRLLVTKRLHKWPDDNKQERASACAEVASKWQANLAQPQISLPFFARACRRPPLKALRFLHFRCLHTGEVTGSIPTAPTSHPSAYPRHSAS